MEICLKINQEPVECGYNDQENPTGRELFATDRKGGFFLGFIILATYLPNYRQRRFRRP
jgi:hypothetical protein